MALFVGFFFKEKACLEVSIAGITKPRLRERGLPVSGRKSQLLERLRSASSEDSELETLTVRWMGSDSCNGISPFLIGNISSIRVRFQASYVRLPECSRI